MPAEEEQGESAAAIRTFLQGPGQPLGLIDPPHHLHLRCLHPNGGCRLIVWCPEGAAPAVRGWAAEHASFRETTHPPASERLLVLEADDPPRPWRWMRTRELSIQGVSLTPEGDVLVTTFGEPSKAQRWAEDHGLDVLGEQAGRDAMEPLVTTPSLLTHRQHEILAWAMTSGYFEVPRQVRLQELADEMGLSMAALSETLRRAERRLVADYLRSQVAPGIGLPTNAMNG